MTGNEMDSDQQVIIHQYLDALIDHNPALWNTAASATRAHIDYSVQAEIEQHGEEITIRAQLLDGRPIEMTHTLGGWAIRYGNHERKEINQ